MTLPFPTLAQAIPGNTVTSALWNANVFNGLTFLGNVPLAVVNQATIQSIPNGSPTALSYDATQLDTYGGHSNTVNPSRYVCQQAGWYFVKAGVVWSTSSTSANRGIQLYKNGTAYPYSWTVNLAVGNFNNSGVETAALVQLAVGDYVEAWVVQNSGGALSTAVVATIASNMQCMWMHL